MLCLTNSVFHVTPHLPPPPLPDAQPDHHPADPDGKVKECMYTCVRLYHAASVACTVSINTLRYEAKLIMIIISFGSICSSIFFGVNETAVWCQISRSTIFADWLPHVFSEIIFADHSLVNFIIRKMIITIRSVLCVILRCQFNPEGFEGAVYVGNV